MRIISILSCMGVLLLIGAGSGAQAAEAGGFDPVQYEGKVVVVDFWASWCEPCRRSFPWLNAMHAKYAAQGLVIVGVNLDNDPASAAEFLARYPADFNIVYDDAERTLARQFDVIAMPSSFLLGRNGDLVESHLGFKVRQQAEYEQAIVSALDARGP